jgi:rRNA maturation endonuclease Nob1
VPQSTVALTLGPLARATLLLAVCALALAAIALQFAEVRALYGGDEERTERSNCPACGSRVPAEPDACEYCGEPLEDGAEE